MEVGSRPIPINPRGRSGWGAKADLWLRDAYVANANGSVTVPSEYNLNLGFFYNQPRWSLELDLQNLTNQRNLAGGSAVLEPFYAQTRVTYRF